MRESERLEVACDFDGAARAALEERDLRRALRLACIAHSEGLIREAEDALVDQSSDEELVVAAEDLSDRGFHAAAGRLFESAKRYEKAGAAYAAGGEVIAAAHSYEKAGQPAVGARTLENALRDHAKPDGLRLELARLLSRHGRIEPAIRVLQSMTRTAPERRLGLPLLARSLKALGLAEAAREVDLEMESLAISPDAVIEVSMDAAESKGTVLFGRYETVREIAKTLHARVIEAVDRISGARVAVKLLVSGVSGAGRDAFVRFEREARALTKLTHPAVVPIVGYHPDGPGMVLEWMPGGSLADLLKREVIAPARAAEIVVAMFTALGEAHRIGILHRDVKPANVLFDGIGSPRLADFGAAHLADLSATATAAAIGTISYMSPEQRLGRPATVQSDVYAVGVLLYEMITGELPSHEEGRPLLPLSDFHPDLTDKHDAIGRAMVEQDPSRRPADSFEARKLIESIPWSKRSNAQLLQVCERDRRDHPKRRVNVSDQRVRVGMDAT
jgi:eukaryotic-like serine/threonine-protein kinase